MKQKILFLALSLFSLSFVNCSSDDDSNWGIVPTEVHTAFSAKYPSARNTRWENKGNYKVAEFTNNMIATSAWFDLYGIWYMSEIDIPYNMLPQAVKDAFKSSEYSTWRIDDVDMLERKDTEVIYIIEVEQQNNEADLYYSEDGIMIKVLANNNNYDYQNNLPQTTPTDIEAFIAEKYPQARIIEIERENGMIEADIIHNKLGKEVVFNTSSQWLHTSWDVRVSALPQAVSAIINNTQYTGYRIDDADFVETSQENYYLLELEKGNREIKVKVSENGNILN